MLSKDFLLSNFIEQERAMHFADLKLNSLRIASIYQNSDNVRHHKYAERIKECNKFIDFVADGNGLTHVASSYCRVRHCPTCQIARSKKLRAKFYSVLPQINENFPKHRWVMLTLTALNCDVTKLRETIKSMNVAFQRLIKSKELDKIDGFIKSTEVTYSQNQLNSHPHFHVLLLVKPSFFTSGYVKLERWIDLWQRSLRVDYRPNIDIRQINKDIEKSVLEVLKYSVKSADMTKNKSWFLELTDQLHNLRFISSGGVLKKYLKNAFEKADELIDDHIEKGKKIARFNYRLDGYAYYFTTIFES